MASSDMSWPVDSAFEEVERAPAAKFEAPVQVTASETRTGRLSLSLSIDGDVRRALDANIGDRFKLYSTQTRSGIYLRLVRTDTGSVQLTHTPNGANREDPRTMFRVGGLDLPVRRGKRQQPEWRVIEVSGAKALEMRLAAKAEGEGAGAPKQPSPGEQAAVRIARTMKKAGHTDAEVIAKLKEDQNFNATREWLAGIGRA